MVAFIMLFTFVHPAIGQNPKPFTSLDFDKVIMYDFNGAEDGEAPYIVDTKGVISSEVVKQTELSMDEVKAFNAKIESKKSYGEATGPCFDPHLGFVYYFNKIIVAHVTISLECNRLHPSMEIPAQLQGKVSVSTDTYYTKTGMSSSCRHFINKMVIRHSFSHPLAGH